MKARISRPLCSKKAALEVLIHEGNSNGGLLNGDPNAIFAYVIMVEVVIAIHDSPLISSQFKLIAAGLRERFCGLDTQPHSSAVPGGRDRPLCQSTTIVGPNLDDW